MGAALEDIADGSFGSTAFLKYLSGRLEAVMWLTGGDGQLRIYKNTQICSFGCKFGCKYNKSLIIRLYCGEDEIRTRGQDCSRRRFSKPVVSATHPPLL